MWSLYDLAIIFLRNIGPKLGKRILDYFETGENFFKASIRDILKVPGLGENLASSIVKEKENALKRAEQELDFIEKYNVKVLFYKENSYPTYLKEIDDLPLFLFQLGNFEFNSHKLFLSIVGTRKATKYGLNLCNQIITNLANNEVKPVIISGLAYGIDYCAHLAALENGLPTLAILAHGLDTIYPSVHKNIAKKIIDSGGALITEFPSKTKLEKQLFVRRNRIIAALGEGLLVVESGKPGGALITADYAFGYNRLVMAIPGRPSDDKSKGCNWLIKTNKAALVENAEDIIKELNWDIKPKQKRIEFEYQLSPEQQKVIDLLNEKEKVHIDEIVVKLGMNIAQIQAILFELELNQLVVRLPGNFYMLN